jgi:NAD(P)-dependent dehydrogenase (short-subunit alcohol dehydrogenase family)
MNIIITGASRGIGYYTSLLLDVSHQVIAVSRSSENLRKLREASVKKNPQSKLLTMIGDIASEESLSQIIDTIKSQFEKIDVLINNAGMLVNKKFESLTFKDWSDIYTTNVFGTVMMTKGVLPLMKSGGHIVNISSMGGFQGSAKFKGLSAYSSSKAAMVAVTECLAEELKEKKIAVNCLCLGSVQTEMFEAAFPSFTASVSPLEIAGYIAQFATEGQKFFNGKIIPVSISTP